jgi:hypothetical protein
MTLRKALQVLIRNAAENQAGVGCGVRQLPADEERRLVAQAIEKVWSKAYTYPFGPSERANLRLGL